MAALAEQVSEARLAWMMNAILEKLASKSGNLSRRITSLLKEHDKDKSGELEMPEFAGCIGVFLQGLDDHEFVALANKFDSDGSGAVSVAEFTNALLKLAEEREENGPQTLPDGKDQPAPKKMKKRAPNKDETPKDAKLPETPAAGDPTVQFFHELRLRTKKLANVARAADAFMRRARHEALLEDRLVKRALERHRSTVRAKHLTARQFEVAMEHFDVDEDAGLFDNVTPQVIWKACEDGEIKDILFRFAKGDARLARHLPDRATRAVIKLRNTLLDKFIAMPGNSLRQSINTVLSHYDADGSGELEQGECVRAFRGLLPGVDDESIWTIIDQMDTDKSATLTTAEITAFLLASQDQRDPQATSLGGI